MCVYISSLFCLPFAWQQYDIDSMEDTFLINSVSAIFLHFPVYFVFERDWNYYHSLEIQKQKQK